MKWQQKVQAYEFPLRTLYLPLDNGMYDGHGVAVKKRMRETNSNQTC